MNTEDQLQQMLRREAGRAVGGSDFDEVRARARRIRRRRRQAAAAIVAAAVVVVVVPTTLALQGGPKATPVLPAQTETSSPSPAPTPTRHPSPSPDTTDQAPRTLSQIPRGTDTSVSHLGPDGLVHSAGATSRLPGKSALAQAFAPYHGGWLVLTDGPTLSQYDSAGNLVRQGEGSGIAMSADQQQTAYQIGRKIRLGISTGMGNGEQEWTVPLTTTLIGVLSEGPVILAGQHPRLLTSNGTSRALPGDLFPTVAGAGHYLGGVIGTVAAGDQEGAVTDVTTGTMLWHNSWQPLRFSDDGKYVVASPVVDNGGPSAIAILDVQSGSVVARTPKLGEGLYLAGDVAWDGNRAVFGVVGDRGRQEALVALDTSGSLTRVSDIATVQEGQSAFRFAVQP